MTVLLVDDFKAMLDVLQTVFERQGYTVFVAGDGQEAITIFIENPIDTVVADFHMPGMNGLEVGKHIRSLKPDTRLILFTSCDENELPSEAYEVFDKVCQKSIPVPELLEAVAAVAVA